MHKSDTVPRGRDDTFPLGAPVTVDGDEHERHRAPFARPFRLDSVRARFETFVTEGMIANAILHLLAHPDQRALVEEEPALLQPAVEESLRFEPAAAVVDRYATRDAELGGAAIRAGELVTVSIAGANRDPSSLPDPDRFDVGRPNSQLHLAFAQGPHVCLGMHLARIETHTAVRGALDRLPRLRLDPEQPSVVRGLVFRKPQTLHVVWG
jgi:cytochrome P450